METNNEKNNHVSSWCMWFVFVSKNNLELWGFMARHQRFCRRVVCDAVVISTTSRRIQRWLQWVLKYITLIRENSNLRDNTNWHNRKYTDVARTVRAIVIYGKCQINVAHNRKPKIYSYKFHFQLHGILTFEFIDSVTLHYPHPS